jgi:hypothetical protein
MKHEQKTGSKKQEEVIMSKATVNGKDKSSVLKIAVSLLIMLFFLIPGPGLINMSLSQAFSGGWDDDQNDDQGHTRKNSRFCSKTAGVAYRACRNEIRDDYWVAIGKCINLSDADERAECRAEARDEIEEGSELCADQHEARLDLCGLLGEGRYDPEFDPDNFINPLEIGTSETANPYFPLIPGTRWVYEGDEEVNTVTVTDKIKLIEGVTCVVVHDVVEEDGIPLEDTDDWYAQDKDGNVWYCGEISKDFETFEGDDPEDPELVEIEGSWKAGRDGAKPGILMLAAPKVGDIYRQEMALGDAEDAAEVISTTGSEMVPAAACNGDCLVTRDFTPIEPGINESKYYKPGTGLILEVDDEGNRLELVEMTTP